MTSLDINCLADELALSDYAAVEPALRQLNGYLTLRSCISGYSLSKLDEEIWTALRQNKVALGIIRRQATYIHVSRWFSYIEASAPQLASSGHSPKASALTGKHGDQRRDRYNMKLQDAHKGVVTRFPPEPSGYLHIGHAKAAFLNDYFAHNAATGSLILRFDDTNPLKEKQEYEDSIREDLALLGIKVQRVTYTSDYFQQLSELAKKLISSGNAYADDTDSEARKKARRDRQPSARRGRPVDESLAMFDEMLRGTNLGKQHCIRARIQFDSSVGPLRDPIIYRFPSWDAKGPQPHHRTGWSWQIYPTYDFACPLVDSIEGVTHALRTTEYSDYNEQYHWFLKALDMRPVYLWDFARVNFIKTFLSKRKLASVVDTGRVDGWDDPRMPTVRGILRRGLTVEALREFMLKQGPSRNVVSMDWTVLWATNKKIIDPIASRHAAIEAKYAVTVTIDGLENKTWLERRLKHAKYPDLGTKQVTFSNKFLVEQVDAAALQQGEELTLMGWGNACISNMTRVGDRITGLQATLNLGGDASKTKKIHWVAALGDRPRAELWEFDHLLTKDSLAKTDNLETFLNPVTSNLCLAHVGPDVGELGPGHVVQLERKGYFRVDKALGQGPEGRMVLFKIPTGSTA